SERGCLTLPSTFGDYLSPDSHVTRRYPGGLMRRAVTTGLLVLALLAMTVPVGTITNGQPDGNKHPYVGLVLQPIPSMPGFVIICSGSALSSTVFLTAAHCADPANPVFVTYKSGPPFTAADFTAGTFQPHPDWCLGCGPGLP